MPRKPLILTSKAPYHVTNRSNNKEFFYLPMQEVWKIFVNCLMFLKVELEVDIHAFVLMSNHYHLLLSTPQENLTEAMTYLHREVARRGNRRAQRINHFFGGRYKWTVIYDESYYWNSVKYIFRNPVEAGISNTVEGYKYSSLNSKLKLWKMTDFFRDPERRIDISTDWLNASFEERQKAAIQKALRRREFILPRDKNGNLVILDALQRQKELGT